MNPFFIDLSLCVLTYVILLLIIFTVNFWFKTTEHTATFANDYVTLWSVEGPGTTSFSFNALITTSYATRTCNSKLFSTISDFSISIYEH